MIRPRTRVFLAVVPAAAVLAGCGSVGSPAASRPDPAAPVALSAFVTRAAVRLAPSRLGAGPVLLTVANQSPRAVTLIVAQAGAPRTIARTAPINPGGVTQVSFDLGTGTYAVAALTAGPRTDAARARASAHEVRTTLYVGAARASSGDQVLQP